MCPEFQEEAGTTFYLFVNVEAQDDGGPDGEDDDDGEGDPLRIRPAHALPAALEHLAVSQHRPRTADVATGHLVAMSANFSSRLLRSIDTGNHGLTQ